MASNIDLKAAFKDLSQRPKNEKIDFSKLLLYEMTIMNRAFWSDADLSETDKVECLKWSNELAHRIWNFIFELESADGNTVEFDILGNVRFYSEQSNILEVILKQR